MINCIIVILTLLNKYHYGSYSRAVLKQKHGIRGLVQDTTLYLDNLVVESV